MVGLLLAALMGGVVVCVTGGEGGDIVLCLLSALALVISVGIVPPGDGGEKP
jgi:hypothetical protein